MIWYTRDLLNEGDGSDRPQPVSALPEPIIEQLIELAPPRSPLMFWRATAPEINSFDALLKVARSCLFGRSLSSAEASKVGELLLVCCAEPELSDRPKLSEACELASAAFHKAACRYLVEDSPPRLAELLPDNVLSRSGVERIAAELQKRSRAIQEFSVDTFETLWDPLEGKHWLGHTDDVIRLLREQFLGFNRVLLDFIEAIDRPNLKTFAPLASNLDGLFMRGAVHNATMVRTEMLLNRLTQVIKEGKPQ